MMKMLFNKTYPDTNRTKLDDHLSLIEKDYIECNLRRHKQSEEVLIGKKLWKRLFKSFMMRAYLINLQTLMKY